MKHAASVSGQPYGCEVISTGEELQNTVGRYYLQFAPKARIGYNIESMVDPQVSHPRRTVTNKLFCHKSNVDVVYTIKRSK